MYLRYFFKGIAVLAILISTTTLVLAQQTYKMQSGSELTVEGTSTLHDWEMTSKEATGEAVLKRDGNNIAEMSKVEINLKAESLKSDSRRMDNNAYSALNTKNHSNIRFRGTNVREITANYVVVSGTLTISGTSKPATLKAEYKINGDRIRFTGEHDISFSEFNLDAPTAMLGTVRTGNELKVKFDVTFR